jgi:hypothetical protein
MITRVARNMARDSGTAFARVQREISVQAFVDESMGHYRRNIRKNLSSTKADARHFKLWLSTF